MRRYRYDARRTTIATPAQQPQMTWRVVSIIGQEVTMEWDEPQPNLVFIGAPRMVSSVGNELPTTWVQINGMLTRFVYPSPQPQASIYTLPQNDPGVRNVRGGFIAPGVYRLQNTIPPQQNIQVSGVFLSPSSLQIALSTAAASIFKTSDDQAGAQFVLPASGTIDSWEFYTQTELLLRFSTSFVPGDMVEIPPGCFFLTTNSGGYLDPGNFVVP